MHMHVVAWLPACACGGAAGTCELSESHMHRPERVRSRGALALAPAPYLEQGSSGCAAHGRLLAGRAPWRPT